MKYVKTINLDLDRVFFHFTRIDNRNSIEKNGLVAVAGGENKAGNDSKNPTIYFSYGADGLLKAIDVWIKWEYNKLRWERDFKYSPAQRINEEIMYEAYQKIYEDFKNRNYYSLDLIEGEDAKTSDFSFNGIDKKKEYEYNRFLYRMELYKKGELNFKPQYPNKDMEWMYGSYSDFKNGNIRQETWNMNTHIGNRVISSDRICIVEGENGRTDGLSIAIEIYNKYREKLSNIDLSRLDEFIKYAKERYQKDEDFVIGGSDFGRRCVESSEERKFQLINKISTQTLGQQVLNEMLDVELIDETEKTQNLHQHQLEQKLQDEQVLDL